jgi:hypothetical protein
MHAYLGMDGKREIDRASAFGQFFDIPFGREYVDLFREEV